MNYEYECNKAGPDAYKTGEPVYMPCPRDSNRLLMSLRMILHWEVLEIYEKQD